MSLFDFEAHGLPCFRPYELAMGQKRTSILTLAVVYQGGHSCVLACVE
ncbi:MAG: hypothetical protein IPP76_13360 [Moraxellaceae bacterium]|nr:hypothetical protein [Moraxellaceae bacterium]